MGNLPILSAKKIIKVIQQLGFEFVRQKGSHMIYRHPDGRLTVVPNHPGEDIDRGLLYKIIRKDIGISADEFMKYL